MKEKQIEEMARIAFASIDETDNAYYGLKTEEVLTKAEAHSVAEALYNAGYRKQSEGEWIRYPHGSGIYCSLCRHKRRYRDKHDAFCPNCGARMKGANDEHCR